MKKLAIVTLALAGTAAPALADQCLWIPKATSSQALSYLSKGAVVQEYCAPCNDATAKKTVIDTTTLKTQDAQNVTIVANGNNELDLAYVYVGGDKRGGSWQNLAMLVKCEVSDVPKVLPGNKVAK